MRIETGITGLSDEAMTLIDESARLMEQMEVLCLNTIGANSPNLRALVTNTRIRLQMLEQELIDLI